ncbi:MAG: GNAT family N-acetyltransferase [Saprospiraceae bacterium]|nr:GNAT family N-acetyltransferase [Saprospiraceae bacterium]
MAILIQTFHTGQAALYAEELAHLRIELFKDFPYLYDGSMDYEEKYLQTLIESPENTIVMAFDDGKLVGAATGLPLRYQTINIQQPYLEKGYDIDRIYYLGESIIRKTHRGQGIGKAFFQTREERAKGLGWYDFVTFCNIERPVEYPPTYVAPDEFWKSMGYRPTDLLCEISWKDLNETDETPKKLRFWLKDIDNR